MTLWLPPGTTEKMWDERAKLTADYLSGTEVLKTMRRFNKALREIDPRLQIVKARDDTDLPGLRPGYWHVIRENPLGTPGVFVVEGPDGEFREPDSSLLEKLRSADLWNDRVVKDREKRSQALSRAAEREREREREDRLTELHERYKTKFETQISVPRGL